MRFSCLLLVISKANCTFCDLVQVDDKLAVKCRIFREVEQLRCVAGSEILLLLDLFQKSFIEGGLC